MTIPFQSDALGKLILRLTLGGLILFHGVSKVLNPAAIDGISKNLATMGLPGAFGYAVYLGEVLAPLLILLGLYSRVGGLLVMINMIFAVLLNHTAQIMTLSKSGGWALELQGFYFLCGLTVFLLGSGRFAVKPD